MKKGQFKTTLVGLAMAAVALWALAANLSAIERGHGWQARAHAELTGGAVEIHYAPAENLEAIDVALIDSAGDTIDMAAYVLTDWAVIDALVDAGERGVTVRIWRDPTEARFTDAAQLARLEGAGNVAVRIKPTGALMHLKSYLVDGATLRTGSANFSDSGEKRQDNDIIILRQPGPAARFEANFAAIWRP